MAHQNTRCVALLARMYVRDSFNNFRSHGEYQKVVTQERRCKLYIKYSQVTLGNGNKLENSTAFSVLAARGGQWDLPGRHFTAHHEGIYCDVYFFEFL